MFVSVSMADAVASPVTFSSAVAGGLGDEVVCVVLLGLFVASSANFVVFAPTVDTSLSCWPLSRDVPIDSVSVCGMFVVVFDGLVLVVPGAGPVDVAPGLVVSVLGERAYALVGIAAADGGTSVLFVAEFGGMVAMAVDEAVAEEVVRVVVAAVDCSIIDVVIVIGEGGVVIVCWLAELVRLVVMVLAGGGVLVGGSVLVRGG